MSRVVGFVCGLFLLSETSAAAQDPGWEQGEPAPAPAATPAATEPQALPPLEDSRRGGVPWAGQPVPSGFWLDGGLGLFAGGGGGKAWARVDFGIPLGGIEGLALQLPLFVTREHVDFIDYEVKWVALGITPGITYEHSLSEEAGRFSVYGEFGGGVFLTFTDVPDLPFMPGGRDTTVEGAIRLGLGARYTFPFGLFASLQPLGLAVFFGQGGYARYDFALTVGYRFD